MNVQNTLPIFDGHNDTVLRLRGRETSFLLRGSEGHIDLPRAREGGLGGGFCAIFTRSAMDQEPPPNYDPRIGVLGPTVDWSTAHRSTLGGLAWYFRLEQESDGRVKIIRTAAEIEDCLADGTFAILLHIEGAESIDPDLYALEVFHRAGLRSLGPVWSRPNVFGHGVPFQYDHSPDTGPGLTDLGRRLVRACNRLRLVVDLSHLSEQGFWDVAALTDAPLVASHSNAYALCPQTRNLTDRQLDAIRDSDGMVGVNFCVSFLREDGRSEPQTSLDEIVRHLDYLVERLGIDRVGFGSDFDGALIPTALGDASGLPGLIAAIRNAGYDDGALRKLAHENWIRVLRRTWGT